MQGEETTRRELTAADYVAMVRRHWVMIAVLTVLGPPIGYGLARVIPPRYESQTLVLVQPPSVPTTIVPSMDTTTMNQKLQSLQQQILSATSLESVIKQYGLYADERSKKPLDQLVAELKSAIHVTAIAPLTETESKDLPGFSVSVTFDDAHTAQNVCAQITSMFIQASNGDTMQQSQQVTQFLTQQVAEAKTSLDAQDAKLAAFKSRYLGSLPDDKQTNLNFLTELNTQLDAASQALARAQQDKTFAQSMLQQGLAQSQAQQDGQSPSTLGQQLATLKTQLATEQEMYKDDYPDVIKTKADIAALEKQIAAANNTDSNDKPKNGIDSPQVTALRAQIHGFDQVIAEKTHEQDQLKEQIKLYEGRIQQSPEVEQEYTELTRGRQTANDSYNALLKEQGEAQMSGELNQQQQGEYFHVLDAANLPSRPAFPNPLMFTASGFAGGLGLGLGLTLFIELKDTSFKTERDVEFVLQLPVLALIPAVQPITTKKSNVPVLQAASPTADLGLRT